MTGRRRPRGTTVGVAVAGTLLSACTAAPGPDRAAGPPPASPSPGIPTAPTATPEPGEPTASPEAAPSPPSEATETAAPPLDACYRLALDEVPAPTSDEDPVPCTERHTSQTYHVGQLDLLVNGHLLAVDSRTAQQQVAASCPRLLARFIGGTPRERRLARLVPVWFMPSLAQSDNGASWYRCDVVALAGPDGLAALPRPRRLRGILDRRGALAEVGLCGTAAPGSRRFERVICSRRHRWRAVTTIDIPGGDSYPGSARARRAGDQACRDHVRRISGSPDRFTYGWEWPTREQWRAGQHYGYCWAPD